MNRLRPLRNCLTIGCEGLTNYRWCPRCARQLAEQALARPGGTNQPAGILPPLDDDQEEDGQ